MAWPRRRGTMAKINRWRPLIVRFFGLLVGIALVIWRLSAWDML